jgi:hypothetical protein
MSFREWLPVTTRNRVALGLAALALVIFVVWNSLPFYVSSDQLPVGIVATVIWPEVFSPDNYIRAFRSKDFGDFFDFTVSSLAVIQCAFASLLAMPFWKTLHASPYIWMPLAFVNLIGAAIHLWFALFYGLKDPKPNSIMLPFLIALNMLTLYAALFTFQNELAQREERNRPQTD